MPTLFILDVPEFAPLVAALGADAGVQKRKHGPYWAFHGDGHIALDRISARVGDAAIGEAIWFGALTGGFEGRVAEFSSDRLRIVPD